ncbi:hypothetical protein CXT87_03865 [Akkermansia muciniphila]|jgi:hypothetical protein|nr:hypothetical protein CXT93_04495 [Akkermansia muciniphila]PND00914.1 hypothetical protein CXT87_03865 [Akkermansia muciniphila]PND03271.1 hypothetical protein CXT86_09835 [Akkermansia muciniphila]PND11230.1 hypothetical protein CXT85_01155 [Akkermansia muciniphila]
MQKVMEEYQPELHRTERPSMEVHWNEDRNKFRAYFPGLTHRLAAHGKTRGGAVCAAERLLRAKYPRDVMR